MVSRKRYYINPFLCIFCTVTSSDQLDVQVSQNGLNSVLVTWTPSGIRYVIGHTIYYQQKGEQSVLTEEFGNVTRATISGLITGSTYSISVSADTAFGIIIISTIALDITIGTIWPTFLEGKILLYKILAPYRRG